MLNAGMVTTLNLDELCYASAWRHNCGLNCLTHFLSEKVLSGEIQRLYSKDPGYQLVLKEFQDYYKLSVVPTWRDIEALLKKYPHPLDREVIFGPVFRKCLMPIISQKHEILEQEIEGAFTGYAFTQEEPRDINIPIVKANRKIFNEARIEYQGLIIQASSDNTEPSLELQKSAKIELLNDAKAKLRQEEEEKIRKQYKGKPEFKEKMDYIRDKYATWDVRKMSAEQLKKRGIEQPTQRQILDKAKILRFREVEHSSQRIIQEKFKLSKDTVRKNYAELMSDHNSYEFVSATQLMWLTHSLHIGIVVKVPEPPEQSGRKIKVTTRKTLMEDINKDFLLTMYNAGNHWEFEEFSGNKQKLIEHNDDYFNPNGRKRQLWKKRENPVDVQVEIRSEIGKILKVSQPKPAKLKPVQATPVEQPKPAQQKSAVSDPFTQPSSHPKRPPHVGSGFKQDPVVAQQSRNPTFSQSAKSVANVRTFITDQNKSEYHIKKVENAQVGVSPEQPGLAVTFDFPKEPKVFIENTALKEGEQGLLYSVHKDMEDDEFAKVAKVICRLAVKVADPDTEFDLVHATPLQRKKLLYDAFQAALAEDSRYAGKKPLRGVEDIEQNLEATKIFSLRGRDP